MMCVLREDWALADVIVLEGMGSSTIEHGAADELVRTESCKGNVSEKRKEKKPNLMPAHDINPNIFLSH